MAQGPLVDLVCAVEDAPRLAVYAPHFPLVRAPDSSADFYLAHEHQRLALFRRGDTKGLWVEVAEIQRRLKGSFLLGRACGIRRGTRLRILDATAGLGVDGLALALSGQDVHLVEREPVLWALLHDLVRRIELPDDRVRLTLGDSRRVWDAEEGVVDVIYFDPMFALRSKTALPGKRMQYLAALLGESEPTDVATIGLAQQRAAGRVVLKRRLKDPILGKPDWTIRGRAVRYDVYRGLAEGGQGIRS